MSSSNFTRLKQKLGCISTPKPDTRTVYIGNKYPPSQDVYIPEIFHDNQVISSKYTVWNFLPKNLFEQFRRIANFYFLCIGVIQLSIDTPVTPITSIVPLVFVISVAAIKQGYEDWLRHEADKEVNSRPARVLRDKQLLNLKSMHIKVGDVVKVKSNEGFPCDLLLLSSSNKEGECYITTANLDGETNLKTHSCVSETKHLQNDEDFDNFRGFVECEQPVTDLYRFIGNITICPQGRDVVVKPLGPENVLLRGARLKNTSYIYGCAIYTGQETKMALNSKFKQAKFSRVEKSMNKYLLTFLLILLVECSVSTGLKYWYTETHNLPWYIPDEDDDDETTPINIVKDFLAFMVLFNYIIPISLYVTVELQKFIGSMFFSWDKEMYDEETNLPAKANTSDLNEELGQIEYLFTDKTGTLTENEMKFRQCSIDGQLYEEVAGRLYSSIHEQTSHYVAELSGEMEDFFRVLCLCHTCRVDVPDSVMDDTLGASSVYHNEYEYQASSPDEKAFVEACNRYGIVYHGINNECMEVSFLQEMKRYKLLHVLEFDSERKRMSVIVQTENGDKYLLCKGAESKMLDRGVSGDIISTRRHIDHFAMLGLRTLVIAQRKLSDEEYKIFDKKLKEARTALHNRHQKLGEAFDLIENEFHILGGTAVEDRLQEDVPKTIELLRLAGIKVWILTGDKEETAVNISYSAGHFKQGMTELYLTKLNELMFCVEKIRLHCINVEQGPLNMQYVLIVDGQTLSLILQTNCDMFIELSQKCVAVLCCRMSPIQKAEIVRLIKTSKGQPVTAAVGDGANDVSMIQEADIGIGIMGKEGRQAVRSSDYAFVKFKFLMRALLIHGHYYYIRIATIVQYFFYKNIAFITSQIYFGINSQISEQPLFDSFFLLFYNIVFSSLPVLMYGLFEQHETPESLLLKPHLYKKITRNKILSWKNFLKWNMLGVYHSVVFYYGVYLMFHCNAAFFSSGRVMGLFSFGTVVFSVCAVTVNIKLALETYYWCAPTVFGYVFGAIGCIAMTLMYNGFIWPSWMVDSQSMHFVVFEVFRCGLLWFLMFLLVVTALLPDILMRVFRDIKQTQEGVTKSRSDSGESVLLDTYHPHHGRKLMFSISIRSFD